MYSAVQVGEGGEGSLRDVVPCTRRCRRGRERRKPARCCIVYSAVRVGGGRTRRTPCSDVVPWIRRLHEWGGDDGPGTRVLRRSGRAGVEEISREKLCRFSDGAAVDRAGGQQGRHKEASTARTVEHQQGSAAPPPDGRMWGGVWKLLPVVSTTAVWTATTGAGRHFHLVALASWS